MSEAAKVGRSAKKPEMGVGEAVEQITRRRTVVLEGAGMEAVVHVCKVKDIPVFLKLVERLYTELGIDLGNKKQIESVVLEKLNDGSFLLKLISENWDEFTSLIQRFSDMQQEQIVELDIDDAVVLVRALMEVNYHFFMKAVLPRVPGVLGNLLVNGDQPPQPEKT